MVKWTATTASTNRGTQAYWNRAGGGQLVVDRTVAADAEGVASIRVPLHSVFALTTKALPADMK
ncbi:MAG TPA: hypothetical protein VGJ25_07230 [Gaiellaceae bacterium]